MAVHDNALFFVNHVDSTLTKVDASGCNAGVPASDGAKMSLHLLTQL